MRSNERRTIKKEGHAEEGKKTLSGLLCCAGLFGTFILGKLVYCPLPFPLVRLKMGGYYKTRAGFTLFFFQPVLAEMVSD